MSSTRQIIFLLILVLSDTIYGKVVELYDGFIYNELKSRISKNTYQENKPNEIFQQLEFKLRVKAIEDKIEGYALFKTEYSQFNWKKDKRMLYINSFGLKFFLNPVMYLKLGSLYIDFSPYVLKSYPWVTDIFRGLSFNIEKSDMFLQIFTANNAVNPDESNWEAIYNNTGFDYDYSTVNLGKNNEYPTLWAGMKFYKSSFRRYSLTYNFAAIYLHENYQLNDYSSQISHLFFNDIASIETGLKFLDYLNLGFTGSAMNKRIKNYTITSNITTGERIFDYRKTDAKKTGGWKVDLSCDDLFGDILSQYDTSFYLKYENIDMEYRPIYMDCHLENRTIEFEANVFNGRQGYFWKTDIYLGSGFKAGIGYQEYTYDYKYSGENVYSFYGISKNPTISEKQIRISEKLSKKFRLQFIYQMRQIKNGLFYHRGEKLDSFYLKVESDPIDNMFVAVEYAFNNNYLKNFNELMIKLMVWGL